MADVFLFLQQGWKNIWKQNNIWLFSVLALSNNYFPIIQIKYELQIYITTAIGVVTTILSFVGFIGVPYLAFCFSVGKPVTIHETLTAVRKFSWRVIGCSCLTFLILSPFFCLFLIFSINNISKYHQLSNNAILLSLPLSAFSAMWDFSLVGFFKNDWGVRQTVSGAWTLFLDHAKTLAILGIILTIIFRIYSTVSGILTVLIQSGFTIASLNGLNYINPSSSLIRNILYLLISNIGSIIFFPLSASVFTLAYLKYSGVKMPSLTMKR
jgi:hypothetical protein